MSYIPVSGTKNLKSSVCRQFGGLNRSEYIGFGEFSDMKNLSSNKYPYLSPSAEKCPADKYSGMADGGTAQNIRAVISPPENSGITKFCGVIGTTFYYNGVQKQLYQPTVNDESGNYLYGMEIPADGVIQLLWVNKTILIHGYGSKQTDPFIYYYDTESESTDDYVKSYEYTHKGWYGEVASVSKGYLTITFSLKRPQAENGGFYDFKKGESVFVDGIMRYSDSRWDTKSIADATSAVIDDYTETVSTIEYGEKVWNITIKISLKNYLGEPADIDSYSKNVYRIYRKIPYMTHLALHNGRLWGASPNGEIVYASALNDIFNFSQYDGLSDDSVYIESSTEGGHLGVISCGNCLAVMKNNSMSAVYGDLPDEMAVGKSYGMIGCRDINSCVVINNKLYFLGERGFYEWSGTFPSLISEKISKKYISAFGMTDGQKYYVSAYDGKTYENLTYDIKYRVWHKEDSDGYSGGFYSGSKRYVVTGGKLYMIEEKSSKPVWYAQSGKIFYENFELDRVNEMWIYLKAEEDGEIEVFSSSDGAENVSCAKLTIKKTNGRYVRIPVRAKDGMYWQYRINGRGNIIIYGIKIVYEGGGRIYSNERNDNV